MALPANPLRLIEISILFVLLALSISADARPCKTLFISSYSVSFKQPSFPHDGLRLPKPIYVTFVSEIRPLRPTFVNNELPNFSADLFPYRPRTIPTIDSELIGEKFAIDGRPSHIKPFGFSSYDFSSLRDRTKDILSVVVALLFGVGCGALTAVTMYLGWSLFSNRSEYRSFYDDYGDDDDSNDEIDSPKKGGYVKIPAAESEVAPAKESA